MRAIAGQSGESGSLKTERMAYSLDETAAMLGRSRKAIYHLIYRGRFPPARKIGGQWVVIAEELRAWLTQRGA